MNRKTLIAIGDPSLRKYTETSSFSRFRKHPQLSKIKKIDFILLSYRSLFLGKLPKTTTDCIIVLFFFPYIHWNKNIEIYNDGKIYGDNSFGRMFNDFFDKADKRLRQAYKDKKIIYVNSPYGIKNDRDKKIAKKILKKNKIPTPKLYDIRSTKGVLKLLNKGNNIFVKPRFGAMGKGISYLTSSKWITNFTCTDSVIISPVYDYRWEFNEVTGNLNFLNNLLNTGAICEQAIESPIIRGRKFDLRIYVIYGKVPYIYARSAQKDKFVTNWSQGGKIEKGSFLSKIPQNKLKEAERLALKTAKALKMNFCGVDIIFSGRFKKAYVLEAQSFPSYESGFDLFGYLIDCIDEED